ncbi:unnamed protein product [Urochloa decumbens]|uniref:F-box domain-containing protein n=1 Tax=Urochloa decumbens TaxID=240449 RepID=A0ABC9GSL9_9POAL
MRLLYSLWAILVSILFPMETKKRKHEALTDPAVTSCPSRRRRRRRPRRRSLLTALRGIDPPTPSPAPRPPPETTRDWAALPEDALLAIFTRLRHVDVLLGAELACAPWRRVAVGKPALWRHVDINKDDDGPETRADAEKLTPEAWITMARAAVGRSAGQCESYRGPAGPEFLAYLNASSPLLRSLDMTSFFRLPGNESADRAMTVIPSFPMLERVVLSRDALKLYMYDPTMGFELRARLVKMVRDLKLPQKLIDQK